MLTGVMLIQRPLNMVAMVVIARLLDPAHFGLVAMALLLMSSTYLIVDLGMGPAIIQTEIDLKKVLFPAFLVTILCGSILTTSIWFFAAPLAAFLGNMDVMPVLRAMSLLVLFEAALSIPDALLRKNLLFGRISMMSLSLELTNTVLTLILAFAGYGVWSLVYARVIGGLVKTILAWFMCPGWDWLIPVRWHGPEMKSILGYGFNTMGGGIVAYFHNNWDDWLAGRMFGPAALGFYRQAFDLSNGTLASLGRGVINSVFFPSYAKITDDPPRLARAYIKSLRFVLLMMAPIALGVFVVAPELVRVLLGAKWIPMIPTLQIYAIMVLTRPLSSNTYPLFMAMGRPDYNLKAGLVLVAVMVPLALLLLPFKIEGIAAAVVTAHVIGAAYNIYQANRLLPGTARETLLHMISPVLSGLLMFGSVLLAKPWVASATGSEYNLAGFLLLVGLGAVIYGGMSLLMQGALLREIAQLVWSSMRVRKRVARAAA